MNRKDKYLETFKLILDEEYVDFESLKPALVADANSVAKFLISHSRRLRNLKNTDFGETPLHVAINLKDHTLLSAILSTNHATIYAKNSKGHTALHTAFKEKKKAFVISLLKYISTCHSSFSATNRDDVLHFHIACITKNIKCVKLFLSLGFDVNSYFSVGEEYSGLNPLHYIVSQKDYGNMYKVFLRLSDLSVRNSEGLTALHSIFYNCVDYSSNLAQLMSQAFNCENYTKFTNSKDSNGLSHFHLCCLAGLPKFVQHYIDNGIDVNCSISLNSSHCPGYTPLHFAVKYARSEVVKLLLQKGADSNKVDKIGVTPLHLVCRIIETDKKLEIIKILLDYSASPVAVDLLGNTPIHLIFCRMSHYELEEVNVLDRLISKIPLHVNLIDKSGLSFFHIVCTRNEPDRVEDYLNSGAAVDSVSNSTVFHGYTPLHFAVAFNQKDVVAVLLKKNASVSVHAACTFDTPLHLACQWTRLKLYSVFRDYENKLQGNKKRPILDWTSHQRNHFDIIKLLLKYGANVDAKNKDNHSPLFSSFIICMQSKDLWSDFIKTSVAKEINLRLLHTSKILISNKASINGHGQETIFHIMCKSEFLNISDDLMEYLLSAGADINSANREGVTPLHLAVESNKYKLVKIFLKFKANVYAQCKKRITPLEKAMEVYNSFQCSKYFSVLQRSDYFEHQVDLSDLEDYNQDEGNQYNYKFKKVTHCVRILLEYFNNQEDECDNDQEDECDNDQEDEFDNDQEDEFDNDSEDEFDNNSEDSEDYDQDENEVTLNKNTQYETVLLVDEKEPNDSQDSDEDKDNKDKLNEIIKCIHILLEYGSEVNLNNLDRSLLHKAVDSEHTFLIKSLLFYGADVNAEDNFYNSPVCSLLEGNYMFNRPYDSCIIFLHIHKLLAAGLYVSDKVKDFYSDFLQNCDAWVSNAMYNEVKNIFNKYSDELNRMKIREIDNYNSLYNILLKDAHEMSKHVKNKFLTEILQAPNFSDLFPLYSKMLKVKFKKGLIRNDILTNAKEALIYIADSNVPDLCCDLIFRHLNNTDIVNLKAAATVKGSVKRKLGISSSCGTEIATKLRKID